MTKRAKRCQCKQHTPAQVERHEFVIEQRIREIVTRWAAGDYT